MNVKIHRVQGQRTRRAHLQEFVAVSKMVMALCMLSPVSAQAFEERWESAAIGTYSPS